MVKLQMTEQEECSCLPTSALEINSSVPTGGEDWTTGRVGIGLDYIYQWEIMAGTTIAGSTGFATDGFADFSFLPEDQRADHSLALSQSAVLGTELSDDSTIYFEWFGIFSHGMEDEIVANVFDIGVDYYVTNNFVLDLRVGTGLSDDADDFFSGVGGGYRF
jgi:Putative MetA-pathway of phenol degradation